MKLLNLLLRFSPELIYLFGSETYSPEHAVIAFVLKRRIKRFQTSGIFNKEVANKFREFILEKGGTEHPMELYKKFRGQEPDVGALLRRAGMH